MTALWQDPVRGMATVGMEQVLICGVVSETYSFGDSTSTAYRFLIQRPDGSFELMDIAAVLGNWRYGMIPTGDRAGQLGWYDLTPDGEELANPIDEDDEDG